MNIEKQVSSLEPSKRLVELGVRVDSYFCHFRIGKNAGSIIQKDFNITKPEECERLAPAWTVAEIGEMLSKTTGPYIQDALSVVSPCDGMQSHAKVKDDLIQMLHDPDLCANVLIWLLENNHVTAKEINEAD
jgi:hypothetical protein